VSLVTETCGELIYYLFNLNGKEINSMTKAFKATKKPVTIEALLWDGGNLRDVQDFSGEEFSDLPCGYDFIARKANSVMSFECSSQELFIMTMEGEMKVSTGDYIIKGVQGEFYPCKPDIFKATYNWRCKCGEDISFESVGCIYCKN
jgi:hypothetical protein